MPRGGRRENSGRKPGVPNRPRAGSALMTAAKLDEATEQPTVID
jgi:hypothetical protein